MIRFIAYSPDPIEGSFRYRDTLQLFPLPDDAPKADLILGQHPFVIEYGFEEMEILELRRLRTRGLHPSSDSPHDELLLSEHRYSKRKEILGILSVISRCLITADRPHHRWFAENNNGKTTGRFAMTGYYWDGFGGLGNWFSAPAWPDIPVIDSKNYYDLYGYVGESFKLSGMTTNLLEQIFQLDEDGREAFQSTCALFSQALECWPISNSLAYIGLVSSLEALIENDHRGAKSEHCTECGQPVYKVRSKFLEFVKKHASSDPGFRRIADRLYSRRSGISHQGKLLAEDVAGRVVTPMDEGQDFGELMKMSQLARKCIVSWLMGCEKGKEQ